MRPGDAAHRETWRGRVWRVTAVRIVEDGLEPAGGQLVDEAGQGGIQFGDTPGAVRRQLDVDPAPAQRQVGVVVERLALRGEPVDELDRGGKVGELDRTRQLLGRPRPTRVQRREPCLDVVLAEHSLRHAHLRINGLEVHRSEAV